MTLDAQSAGEAAIRRKLRWVLGAFMVALILSGITAFPLQSELQQNCADLADSRVEQHDIDFVVLFRLLFQAKPFERPAFHQICPSGGLPRSQFVAERVQPFRDLLS